MSKIHLLKRQQTEAIGKEPLHQLVEKIKEALPDKEVSPQHYSDIKKTIQREVGKTVTNIVLNMEEKIRYQAHRAVLSKLPDNANKSSNVQKVVTIGSKIVNSIMNTPFKGKNLEQRLGALRENIKATAEDVIRKGMVYKWDSKTIERELNRALKFNQKSLNFNNIDRQVARLTATELQRAETEAIVEYAKSDDSIKALRWTLSPNHHARMVHWKMPRGRDICDILAEQNKYGLGEGVYPKNRYPSYPHPWCSCTPELIREE